MTKHKPTGFPIAPGEGVKGNINRNATLMQNKLEEGARVISEAKKIIREGTLPPAESGFHVPEMKDDAGKVIQTATTLRREACLRAGRLIAPLAADGLHKVLYAAQDSQGRTHFGTVQDLALDLGVHRKTVHDWVRAYKSGAFTMYEAGADTLLSCIKQAEFSTMTPEEQAKVGEQKVQREAKKKAEAWKIVQKAYFKLPPSQKTLFDAWFTGQLKLAEVEASQTRALEEELIPA